MARDLARKAQLLNQLQAEREDIEAQLRTVTIQTSYQRVVFLKREHARVMTLIQRLIRRAT